MNYTLFLLPCFLFLQITGAVSATQMVDGTLGRTIVFSQSISDGKLSLEWSFKNNLIVSRRYEFFVNYAPQYKERCKLYSDGTLRLYNLTFTDEGQYTFTADGRAPSQVYLKVFRAESTTQVVNGTLERSIYFYESFPDETLLLEWRFKNNVIASRIPGFSPECAFQYKGRCRMYDDGTLRLDNLTSADEGAYILSAQQSLSVVRKEAIYELRVHSAVSAFHWMNEILGRSVYFDESFLNRTLLLQWSFKNKVIASRIPGNPPRCVPQYGGRCHMYDNGTLRLDHLTLADDGAYSFTAQQPSSTVIREAAYDLRVYSAVSDTQVVNETQGRTIYFYESFSDPTVLLQWSFNNKLIASRIPGYPPECRGRCQLYDDGTLRLDNLRPTDEGNYSFTAQQPPSTVIRKANYKLRVSRFSSSFSKMKLKVGSEITLLAFTSNRPLLLQWSFKNNLIASRIPGYLPECIPQYAGRCQMYDNGPLKLDNLTLTDEGNYMLTAYQSPSTAKIESVYEIKVYVPPENAGHKNNTFTKLQIGETLILSVILVPELETDFTWYHLNPNPTPIYTNGKVLVNSTISSSSLQIKNVTWEDAGKYECRVRHGLGNQIFLFTVIVAYGLSGGAIAGIVIGVLLGVILIGTAVGFFFFRRKKSPVGLKNKTADVIPPNIYEDIMIVKKNAETPNSQY